MISIGLISDTHSHMDEDILGHLKDCDEIWHAGDIGNIEVMDQIATLKKPIRAVYGNIDDRIVRAEYPLNQIFEVEALKVFITHIGGYPGRITNRVKGILKKEKPGLYICGHSHICRIMPDGIHNLLHMNPGACGHIGFHKMRTIILFDIAAGIMSNVRVAELGVRGVTNKDFVL